MSSRTGRAGCRREVSLPPAAQQGQAMTLFVYMQETVVPAHKSCGLRHLTSVFCPPQPQQVLPLELYKFLAVLVFAPQTIQVVVVRGARLPVAISTYRGKKVGITVAPGAIRCLVGVEFMDTPLEMPQGMVVVALAVMVTAPVDSSYLNTKGSHEHRN